MTKNGIMSSISVFDFKKNKLCDLYDSQNDLAGQVYGAEWTRNIKDGLQTLSFSVPYKVNNEKNFRWPYIKSEYLVRLIYNGQTEWFVAQKPKKHKNKNGIYGEVVCSGLEVTLKSKNIYKEFDDENGIGTISELVDQILAGTGWTRGHTDPMLEADGVTEKIRSLNSNGKQGALGLITTVCNLFMAYPIYDTDNKTVALYNFNNRDMVIEGTVGVNLESLDVDYDSSDICTRLYVEGEYGDDGYIGIDDVNPTGLSYIMNFDYYREIGTFTAEHETALSTYISDVGTCKTQISSARGSLNAIENSVNDLIGQCDVVVYYVSTGFNDPKYEYGEMTAAQKELSVGDRVVVLNSNGTFRYATIETTAAALIQTGEYGIAKFVTPAAGTIGAYEVQIEAKEKEIANLQSKINATTQADKIAEYTAEITALQAGIQTIYTQTNGLYEQMNSLMNSSSTAAYFDRIVYYNNQIDDLLSDMNDIEVDFIIAMGDMLRDGYWNNQNYIVGQEAHMYADALEHHKVLSRPAVSYKFDLIRLCKEFGVPLEDFKLNSLFRVHDDDLEVHDNLFVVSITLGIDDESAGNIEVSNKDITLNSNDLGSLLSRMSQLSDLIDQKNTLYDRAKAISQNGTMFADRLNGQIDVTKNQILSSVSNWHTDERGNMVFEAADGSGAMMLSGSGFMLANSKDTNGNWVWRSFGTGQGFTADEIIAGFISADRIEAGSISVSKLSPNVGTELDLSGNQNVYQRKTGIDIDEDGIEISGSKYLKLASTGVLDIKTSNFKLDSTTGCIRIATQLMGVEGSDVIIFNLSSVWNIDNNGVYHHHSGRAAGPNGVDFGLDITNGPTFSPTRYQNKKRMGLNGDGYSSTIYLCYDADDVASFQTPEDAESAEYTTDGCYPSSMWLFSEDGNYGRFGALHFKFDPNVIMTDSQIPDSSSPTGFKQYCTGLKGMILNIIPEGGYNYEHQSDGIDVIFGTDTQRMRCGYFDAFDSKSYVGDGVANNLTTQAAGQVLDARQGKALKDLIDAQQTTLNGLGGAAICSVANNLTTTASGSVLDARQGKTLKDAVDGKAGIKSFGSITNQTKTINFSGNVQFLLVVDALNASRSAMFICYGRSGTSSCSATQVYCGNNITVTTEAGKIKVRNADSNSASVFAIILSGNASDMS